MNNPTTPCLLMAHISKSAKLHTPKTNSSTVPKPPTLNFQKKKSKKMFLPPKIKFNTTKLETLNPLSP